MADPTPPLGVDYYSRDTQFVGGVEVPPVGGWTKIDWAPQLESGVRFAYLKSMQGPWRYDGWFDTNYQPAKDAGLLRGPYLFFHPCEVVLPTPLTAANWMGAALAGNIFDNALTQANAFCDQILAKGWGEPGDLLPMVDIEAAAYHDANGPVLAPVLDAQGNPVLDAQGHPTFADTDLWKRLTRPQRIDVTVVLLVQIENRLGVKPVIYTGNTWREDLLSPTDNAGAGFSVVHNGITYRVANFADYQPWFARYQPLTNLVLDSFPSTWVPRAGHDAFLIWQYRKDPDTSVLVRILGTTPVPGSPEIVHATVEIQTDLAPIDQLASIVKPPARRTLTRISPAPRDPVPARSFNLLLIGQGFRPGELLPVAQRFWTDPAHQTSMTDVAPFGVLANPSNFACYTDDGTGVFLRLKQTPSGKPGFDDVLATSSLAPALLQDYLTHLQVMPAGSSTPVPAEQVWRPARQGGPTGALIAILRNNRIPPIPGVPATPPAQHPGELYQLDPNENVPIPVVAVDVTWNDELWPLPIIRAVAQLLGGLDDEYELPGPEFDHPATDQTLLPAPNLLVLGDTERATLPATANGTAVPAALAARAIAEWRLTANTPLDFYSNGQVPAPLGALHLVEGGDGYRSRVMRCDGDCLMRRMPSGVAATVATPSAKIRAQIRFCQLCRKQLEAVLAGTRTVNPSSRITLDGQRIPYDEVAWATREAPPTGFRPNAAFTRTLSLTVPASEPAWRMTLTYTPTAATVDAAFTITGIQLTQRPGDPYTAASDILTRLGFSGLSVTYTHRLRTGAAPLTVTTALDTLLRQAIANPLDPPRLELGSDGGSQRDVQVGARLTLTFPVTGSWTPPRGGARTITLFAVEVVLGLALTGERQVDPAFPVMGCQLRPVLAMRIKRSSALLDTGGSLVELKGTVVMDAANAIPTTAAVDLALMPIATGKLGATLVCETNESMNNTTFSPLSGGVLTPLNGRKLAAVQGVVAIAKLDEVPPLSWSWRQDYVRTVSAATTVVAAYRSSEPKGDPNGVRQQSVVWPPLTTTQLAIDKVPRQGMYDTLYVHPIDGTASPGADFPGAGDLCLRLPLRRGLGAGSQAFDGGPFRGWGTGRLDQGANTLRGAPLIPPNQHVELTIAPVSASVMRISYAASAQGMRPGEWQVFLEQGLTIGYHYNVSFLGLPWLVRHATLAGTPTATIDALRAAYTAGPVSALDLQARVLMRALHAWAKTYDATLDHSTEQQAPEASAVPGAEAL